MRGRMKLFATISLALALATTACGGDKKEGGGKAAGAAAMTPATALAAAEDRTAAMCACADVACRTAVMSRPDDPFGEKARAARDGFSADQRTQWNGIMTRWAECSMRK
jgi:hypothetical protein